MIPKTRPNLSAVDILSILRPGTTQRDFEEATAAQSGARHGLSFAYAHAGFFALLKAMRVTEAEVIIPAYTCRVMPEVILATGNVPVFVDIDLADYNMNLSALKSAVTSKTRVIVATHMFGYPVDVDAIREIANSKRIVVVEDAALTFPRSMRDLGGLRGDVGLFSFGPGKPLFTIRGGVIITNDTMLYEKIGSYRDREMYHLLPRELVKRWALLTIHYLRSRHSIYSIVQQTNLSKDTILNLTSRFRQAGQDDDTPTSLLPGDYSSRYARFQARIGLAQLRKSDVIVSQRRILAKLYDEGLHGIPELTPAPIVEGASYSLYTVRVRDRDSIGFRQKMRRKGIETGHTFNYALPNLERYRPYAQFPYSCAEQASQEVVNLPTYTDLTETQVRYIVSSARQIVAAGS